MCRKPFQSLGRRICPACLERIDRDFLTVRDYLDSNKGKRANLDKVAEDTEVPKQIIMHLLKEGRLTIDDPAGSGIMLCEVCKKPINTGRMCKDCRDKFAVRMQSNLETKKPAGTDGSKSPLGGGSAKMQS